MDRTALADLTNEQALEATERAQIALIEAIDPEVKMDDMERPELVRLLTLYGDFFACFSLLTARNLIHATDEEV